MADDDKVERLTNFFRQRRDDDVAAKAEAAVRQKEAVAKIKERAKGGGSGGSAADRREAQMGAELDPKSLMKRGGYKTGGKVKSASARADGCAIRGKTRA